MMMTMSDIYTRLPASGIIQPLAPAPQHAIPHLYYSACLAHTHKAI